MKPRRILIPAVMISCLYALQTQAEETPPVVETYTCNYANGKDSKDLEGAISYWNEKMDEMNDENLNRYSAWLITPIHSSLTGDFYWLGASPNFSTWAKGNAAYASNKAGQDADARFQKMSSCTSAAWMSEAVHVGSPPEEGDTGSILEAFGCSLHPGKTMSNVRAAEANFVNHAKAAGMEMNIFRFMPMYTNGQVDLLYFIGHDDVDALAANANKGWNSRDVRTANIFFDMVMDCGGGLYNAEMIRQGASTE